MSNYTAWNKPRPSLSGWSVAIMSSRESIATLSPSIQAALGATIDKPAVIDIIVNGDQSLAAEVGTHIQSLRAIGRAPKRMRAWFLAHADKAHAWNTCLHEMWSGSELAYFIDGYVRLMPDSLALIAQGLDATPNALAATGVPTVGRSAKALRDKMLASGGIHGNLYAVRGEVLMQLRERGFRLPLGIYRTDPLLGAVICFNLNPADNEWDTKRIFVHPQATWACPTLAWWRVHDLHKHANRVMRQAQGVLENLAVHEHLAVQKRRPEDLPSTVSDLVLNWLVAFPNKARSVFWRQPLCFLAVRKLLSRKDMPPTAAAPILVRQVDLPEG